MMLSATPLLPLLAVGGLTMSSAFGLFSLLPLGSDDVHLAVLTVIGAGALPVVLSSGWFLIKATQKGCLYPQGYIAQCVSSIARRQVMVGCAMLTLASIITALGFETQGRCLNGVTVMEPADIDLLSREAKSGGEATRLPANLNIVKFISVKDTEYRKLKGPYGESTGSNKHMSTTYIAQAAGNGAAGAAASTYVNLHPPITAELTPPFGLVIAGDETIGIYVKSITKDGNARKSTVPIRVGMKLRSVGGDEVKGLPRKAVVEMIKQRDSVTNLTFSPVIEIPMTRPFGLRLKSSPNGGGVIVAELTKEGRENTRGRVRGGMRVVAIGDVPTVNMTKKTVEKLIKNVKKGEVTTVRFSVPAPRKSQKLMVRIQTKSFLHPHSFGSKLPDPAMLRGILVVNTNGAITFEVDGPADLSTSDWIRVFGLMGLPLVLLSFGLASLHSGSATLWDYRKHPLYRNLSDIPNLELGGLLAFLAARGSRTTDEDHERQSVEQSINSDMTSSAKRFPAEGGSSFFITPQWIVHDSCSVWSGRNVHIGRLGDVDMQHERVSFRNKSHGFDFEESYHFTTSVIWASRKVNGKSIFQKTKLTFFDEEQRDEFLSEIEGARAAAVTQRLEALFLHISQAMGGVQKASPSGLAQVEKVTKGARFFTEPCSICQEAADPKSEIDGPSEALVTMARLPCSHTFHTECADRWLDRASTCPLCRYDLNAPLDEQMA